MPRNLAITRARREARFVLYPGAMSVKRYIGDYEVVRRLRVGGMATLYLARRHGAAGFSRQVAIKVVHPHLVDQPAFAQMFVDEARICSQIAHPNVVHVEEFGEVDGLHYLVMEYIDGCSCSELVQRMRADGKLLDPVLSARIIVAAAAGLHAAHETVDDDGQLLEVVHRDVSPSNILLTPSGHVKLIDFGIAKARNRVQETEAGFSMKGKYKYVAPEQATRAHVDRRSDIFALGVVFWEMLTGEALFADDTQVGLFNRLTQTNVQAPSAVSPNAPAALDAVVLAMLSHDPAKRPATAADLVKLITAAFPAAAATDPGVLGALVVETRGRRRTPSSAGMSAEGELSHSSLSNTRRSQRMSAPPPDPDYAIEISAPDPTIGAPPPAVIHPPAPRRSRWLVPLMVAGGLVLLGVGGLVGARRDDNPATAAGSLPVTPAVPAVVELPAVGTAAAPVSAPAVDTPAPIPPPAPVVTATAMADEPAPAAKPARPTRAAARAQARPTPRPQPSEVGAPSRAAAPARTKTSSATFVHASFDDDAAETTKPAAAPSKVKVKSTTIVTEFGD